MRKSAAVKLTLVPILAASALAYAQAPGETDPTPDAPPPLAAQWLDGAPGSIEPVLQPPGMTPTIDDLDCDTDPNADLRTDCEGVETDDPGGGVAIVRGGFGHYFWTGGG